MTPAVVPATNFANANDCNLIGLAVAQSTGVSNSISGTCDIGAKTITFATASLVSDAYNIFISASYKIS